MMRYNQQRGLKSLTNEIQPRDILLSVPILSHHQELQPVMLACAYMQGREQEITLSDLVHVASEEQKAWFQRKESYQVQALCLLTALCP